MDKLLKKIQTPELVRELSGRDGVKTTTVEPYHDLTITVSGPAVVVTVID